MSPRTTAWSLLLIGFVVALAPHETFASGFDVPQIGSTFAGPTTTEASAVFHNPAQLGFIAQTELVVGAGLTIGRVDYRRRRLGEYQLSDNLDLQAPIDPAFIDRQKPGLATNATSIAVGPTFDLFVAIPLLRDRLALGIGSYIPYAAKLDYPRSGAQRFAVQSLTLAAVFNTVALAARPHRTLGLGVGLSYVVSALSLQKVQDFAGVDAFADGLRSEPIGQPNSLGSNAPSSVRELDVLARPIAIGTAVSHAVSFNAALAWQPRTTTELAVVYQHGATLRHKGDFMLDLDDDFFTQDLAPYGLQFPPYVRGEARLRFRLPKRITVAARHALVPKLVLEGFASYVFYSDHDRIDLDLISPDLEQPQLGFGRTVSQRLARGWIDSGHIELSLRALVRKDLRLSATLGYHTPAVSSAAIDASAPDGHRLLGAAGAALAVHEAVELFADVEVQGILPRRVSNSRYDVGNGKYRLALVSFALHARVRLGPPARPTGRKRS